MGTTPLDPEQPPTVRERGGRALRLAIAGHPQGAVRRIVLWLVLGLAIPLTQVSVVAMYVAMVTGLLLALTDQLS